MFEVLSSRIKYSGVAFHACVISFTVLLLLLTTIGCLLTRLGVPGVAQMCRMDLAIGAAAVAVLTWLWRTGHKDIFEGLLLYLETKLFQQTVSPDVGLVAHLGFGVHLIDLRLARIDSWLGMYTPAIEAWSRGNAFGQFVIIAYGSIGFFIMAAFFLPLFTRKTRIVRVFLAANILAFVFSYPLLFLFPAVGPWFAYHTTATPGQKMVEVALQALRQPGPCTLGNTAIICIPSFHVIWAVLCGYSLWHFRRIRIPALLVSALFVFSTLATGWHYFIDLIAGGAVAATAILLAIAFVRLTGPCLREKEARSESLTGVTIA